MDTAAHYSSGVHLGLWTNWSRGPVFGSTLTLTQSNSNLLIAFVAFFVTYVGTRFWRVACLVLHFIYSSPAPRDGLYHQRQAILRNTSNAEDGLYTIVRLGWIWRRIARQTWRRILPLVVFTVLCIVGWTLAAGFSSKISTAVGNEVLITGSSCGVVDDDLDSLIEHKEKLLNPYKSRKLQSSGTYAQQCYSPDLADSQYCTTYVPKSINSTVVANASCPFDKEMCRTQSSNFIVDSGYLDSHEHFGLNAPASQRFQYRRVVHCAPLTTENYTMQRNVSSDRSYTGYMFGPMIGKNVTYEYTNDDMFETVALNGSSATPDYQLG